MNIAETILPLFACALAVVSCSEIEASPEPPEERVLEFIQNEARWPATVRVDHCSKPHRFEGNAYSTVTCFYRGRVRNGARGVIMEPFRLNDDGTVSR